MAAPVRGLPGSFFVEIQTYWVLCNCLVTCSSLLCVCLQLFLGTASCLGGACWRQVVSSSYWVVLFSRTAFVNCEQLHFCC